MHLVLGYIIYGKLSIIKFSSTAFDQLLKLLLWEFVSAGLFASEKNLFCAFSKLSWFSSGYCSSLFCMSYLSVLTDVSKLLWSSSTSCNYSCAFVKFLRGCNIELLQKASIGSCLYSSWIKFVWVGGLKFPKVSIGSQGRFWFWPMLVDYE